MDRRRALLKKKSDSNRPTIEGKEICNNITLHLNSGTFETIKPEIKTHFDQLKVKARKVTDNTNVAHTLTYKNGDKYTVNLYPTSSRIVVNGKTPRKFLEILRKALHEIDHKTVETINRILGNLEIPDKVDTAPMRRSARPRKPTEIARISQQQQRKLSTKGQKDRNPQLALPPPTITNETETDSGESTDTEEESDTPSDCPVCNRQVLQNDIAIECNLCEEWSHVNCDPSLNLKIYQEHLRNENKEYVCPTCIIANDINTETGDSHQRTGDGNTTQQEKIVMMPTIDTPPLPVMPIIINQNPSTATPTTSAPSSPIVDKEQTNLKEICEAQQEQEAPPRPATSEVTMPTAVPTQSLNETPDTETTKKDVDEIQQRLNEKEAQLDRKEKNVIQRDNNLKKREKNEKELLLKLKEARVIIGRYEADKKQQNRLRSLETLATESAKMEDEGKTTHYSQSAPSQTNFNKIDPREPPQHWTKNVAASAPPCPCSTEKNYRPPPAYLSHPTDQSKLDIIIQNQQIMLQNMFTRQTTDLIAALERKIDEQGLLITELEDENRLLHQLGANRQKTQPCNHSYSRLIPLGPHHKLRKIVYNHQEKKTQKTYEHTTARRNANVGQTTIPQPTNHIMPEAKAQEPNPTPCDTGSKEELPTTSPETNAQDAKRETSEKANPTPLHAERKEKQPTASAKTNIPDTNEISDNEEKASRDNESQKQPKNDNPAHTTEQTAPIQDHPANIPPGKREPGPEENPSQDSFLWESQPPRLPP